jgi:YidC/Oxa1 family membrane protein insertase
MFAPERPQAPAGGASVADLDGAGQAGDAREQAATGDDVVAGTAPAPQAVAPDTGAADKPAVAKLDRGPEQSVELDTDLIAVTVTSYGGRLKSFVLKSFEADGAGGSRALDMVDAGSLLPLGVYWTRSDGQIVSDTGLDYSLRRERTAAGSAVTMEALSPDGERVTKSLVARDGSYTLDFSVRVETDTPTSIGVAWSRRIHNLGGRFAGLEGPVGFIELDLETSPAAKLEEPVQHEGLTSWAGYADHYFLAAYYPPEPQTLRLVASSRNGDAQATLWADGTDGSVDYGLFVGPKSIDLLKENGHDLSEAVDLGMFAVVARPLLWLLLKLHAVTGNYGWAIILLTVGIRVAFYPINQKQAKAMKAMQRIQPELKKIQEKYKDDREKLNQEMMETYRRHKVNPLAGCLPMILQLPFFLGLYNVLLQAIELRKAPFVGWITDLSQPDRLGSIVLPMVSPPGIPVMTLLMGASMLIQQRMMPAGGDPTQQKMMMFLPLIFTVMFINFPSGLVLYWFANNVMSIGQQYLTNRSTT